MEAVDFENPRWHKSVHSEVVTRKGVKPPFPFYYSAFFLSFLLNNGICIIFTIMA